MKQAHQPLMKYAIFYTRGVATRSLLAREALDSHGLRDVKPIYTPDSFAQSKADVNAAGPQPGPIARSVAKER